MGFSLDGRIGFVALARIDTRETITLKNADGYEKEMPVQSDKKRNSTSYYVVTGWKEFQQSNDISEGLKTRARPLPPAAKARVTEVDADDVDDDDGMDDKDSEDDSDKDEDEDVELDDDVDPFFVATITTGHKNCLKDSNESSSTQLPLVKRLDVASMRSNNIFCQGEKIGIKYITSEDKMCLAKINKAEEDPSFEVTITTTHKSMLNEDAERVDDGDPSFVATINGWMLYMPADFARSAGIDTKKTLTLLGLDGSEKEMPVRYDKKRHYCVAKGWPEFRRNNAILAGDKCVFMFITNDDKLCLATISKKKTPTSPLPPAATKDDDEDDNEDVERVDDEDPFFVATINHKYMLRPNEKNSGKVVAPAAVAFRDGRKLMMVWKDKD
ncbi:DNA-binding pseudobarrel domain-containing protein [Tanacetum coccineum]